MRLWQQPAKPLPVLLRPVGGETLVSYTVRLATTNDLDRPTILLRALGEPSRGWTQSMLAEDYDVALNNHALRRLETFTGIPAARLQMSLPTLHADTRPSTTPATRPYRCPDLREHCEHCAARLPGHPKIRVHSLPFPLICRRHHRWIATPPDQPHQLDITAAPEIRAAHRRYARLLTTTGDGDWTHQQLRQATSIAMIWASRGPLHHRILHARWSARAAALGSAQSPHQPSPPLVFPEAVAITEILCDLHWRRHVAMVEHHWQLNSFYRRIGQRLTQPDPWTFASAIHITNHDPLRAWVAQHRQQHAPTRTELWQRHYRRYTLATPFPEIRHFK